MRGNAVMLIVVCLNRHHRVLEGGVISKKCQVEFSHCSKMVCSKDSMCNFLGREHIRVYIVEIDSHVCGNE